jgi:hypothetical protein
MADMQGRQPAPVETEDTHTLPDLCAQALANAQAHGEDLRQRRQHQPPPASVHLQRNSEPNACNMVGGGGGAPVKSSRSSSRTPTAPAVCAGWVDHRCRSNAPTQPARACRPSTTGTPPQHPDVSGACHRTAGRKLRVTTPACSLLPSRRGRLTAAKPLSPLAARASTLAGLRHHGCTAPRSSARRTVPLGAQQARAQLRCTQHHPLMATSPSRRRC